jgi:hypothetical protein
MSEKEFLIQFDWNIKVLEGETWKKKNKSSLGQYDKGPQDFVMKSERISKSIQECWTSECHSQMYFTRDGWLRKALNSKEALQISRIWDPTLDRAEVLDLDQSWPKEDLRKWEGEIFSNKTSLASHLVPLESHPNTWYKTGRHTFT